MKAEEKTWVAATLALSPRADRRALAGTGLLFAFLLLLLVGPVSSSLAGEHLIVTGEYGKEGPKASGIGGGCHLGYDSASGHLYLASEGKIFGLSVSPGSATPLGGKFPFNTNISTECGEPDIAVDSSGIGNIYGVQSGSSGKVYGWNSTGNVLGSPWPVTIQAGDEVCGVDVGPDGGPWAGDYSAHKVFKFTPSGTAAGSIETGFSVCKLAVDRVNGDLFAAAYGGGQLVKFSAESGYATKTEFPAANGEPGLAVNDAEHKLYVGNGSEKVKVYDTETAALVETINLPAPGGHGLAVDENTDTLYVTIGSGESGYIAEYLALKTPKATTGEPTGNSQVSGTADPNEVGPITECYFEYGPTAAYGSKQNCNEPTPISSVETVHADLPGLIGEETYHYRLVLANGEPFVIGRGADKTITPHNVKALATEPATEITQESAQLNASFEGTNEDTNYYFEWGQTTAYGHKTAVPPGDDAGTTTGPTHISSTISGLEPGYSYHFRVVAQNSIGVSKGVDKAFKTFELPSIEGATTSHLTATSAEIDAKINPRGFETTYYVEYGPSTTYGSQAPIPGKILPAGNTSQAVEIQLTELQGIVYHFRVVAESQWGTVRTEDQSFNFFPQSCPNSAVRQQNESQYLPDCRAFELVSPEETGNVELTNAEANPDPYAVNPPRFAFNGYLGGVQGTEPTNALGADTYIATRTNTGWKTRLVGLRGYEGTAAGTLYTDPTFSKFLDWRENGGFEGEPQPPHQVPYIWDTEGGFIERWPSNPDSYPGLEELEGGFQNSPDLTHLAISSTNVALTNEGLTTGAGSAYDYEAKTGSMTLISKDANGKDIELEPGEAASPPPLGILFPGGSFQFYGQELTGEKPAPTNAPISTDGSHILMATAKEPFGFFTYPPPPMRLYMRVHDAVTYEVSVGKDVSYVGMTPDGTKVFFTSPERLNSEDTDNSVDLYMWSEAGDKLTLVSKAGPEAEDTGNSDECTTTWTTNCGITTISGEDLTDNSFSSETGEIYFYSPEQLDGTKGTPGQENLYVYRNGNPQFVATLKPGGEKGPITRIQVSPDDSHMAFVTASQLTAYNNGGLKEMYAYDPATRKLVCVSCRPDGQPPAHDVEASKMGIFMSDDGRTFFATKDPLVATDTNEQLDVYEFTEGRPQLITTGTGTTLTRHAIYGGAGNAGQEGLAGVSADGVNVYFSTRDVLVPQNHNGPFLSYYDARAAGGFAFEPGLAPCEAADECHGEGNAAPVPPTVTSEGNLGDRGNAPNPSAHKSKPKKQHKNKKHRAKHHRHHKRGNNHA